MVVQRRYLLISLAGIAVLAAGIFSARHIWYQRQRAAIAIAGVAAIPDLHRWPVELAQRIARESAAVGQAGSPEEPLARLATLYCANGYRAEGERALAALRELDPKNARWPYLLADLRLHAGDQEGAQPALQATVELDAGYAPAWLRLGELLANRGAIDPARKCFAQAVAVAPGTVPAQFKFISFDANHGGELDSLRHRLAELARAHPGYKNVHLFLAEMLEAAHDPAGAALQRNRADESELEISTADPWVDELTPFCFDSNRLMLRGVALQREGRLDEAEQAFRKVVQLAPQEPANPLGWELLSNLYLKAKRPVEARATLEAAVAAFPDEPQMSLLLTRLLCTEGQPEAGIAVIQPAVRRWPGRSDLQAALGLALHDAGNYAAAVPRLNEAIRLDPSSTDAQYCLGACLLKLGRRDEAHEAMEKTLAMRPDHPQAIYALAAMDLEAGDFAAAEPYVRKVSALGPDEPPARNLVAALHLLKGLDAVRTGNLDEADRQYRAGLAASPDDGAILREAGTVALRRGRGQDAVGAFEHYLRLEPADPRGHFWLGLALRQTGRGAEANAVFERGFKAAQATGDQALIEEFKRQLGR